MRTIGTVVRGVRAPIIREGDNIAEVAAASVMEAWKEAGIEPRDRDVVAVTESVVARAQGNYATLDQIAKDVREKTGGGTVGVAFPILSRNRFSLLLHGQPGQPHAQQMAGGNRPQREGAKAQQKIAGGARRALAAGAFQHALPAGKYPCPKALAGKGKRRFAL